MLACSGQPSRKGWWEAHRSAQRRLHSCITSQSPLSFHGQDTEILGPPTAGHVSWAEPQPTGDTLAAAEPCPRRQKMFCRLHGQPELWTYCALPTSSWETVPSAHPFTVCFSSDDGKKLSTIKDTNINRPSVGLPAWSFTSPPAHRRNITVVTELLFCSSNDRVTGNTSTTEECSVTQQHFWFIPVCSPEKAKKQLRTALLLACNKCNISAVSWCLNEIPVGHGTLPQGCKVSDEEAHLAFCAQLSGRLLLYSVMQMVWMARHR